VFIVLEFASSVFSVIFKKIKKITKQETLFIEILHTVPK